MSATARRDTIDRVSHSRMSSASRTMYPTSTTAAAATATDFITRAVSPATAPRTRFQVRSPNPRMPGTCVAATRIPRQRSAHREQPRLSRSTAARRRRGAPVESIDQHDRSTADPYRDRGARRRHRKARFAKHHAAQVRRHILDEQIHACCAQHALTRPGRTPRTGAAGIRRSTGRTACKAAAMPMKLAGVGRLSGRRPRALAPE